MSQQAVTTEASRDGASLEAMASHLMSEFRMDYREAWIEATTMDEQDWAIHAEAMSEGYI